MKGQNLIIMMLKPSAPLRRWRCVLTAHNWWSFEYETTASGTTQQYKRKNMRALEVEGCRSSVVRALVAKASGPRFESLATTKIFSHFSFAFIQTPLGEKVSI